MADFHAADLWVAVVPDVSKVGPEMEKAGKDAKGKFGDGIKGLGKEIGEALNTELGREIVQNGAKKVGGALGEALRDVAQDIPGVDKISSVLQDALEKSGKEGGKSFGKELAESAAKEIGATIGEAVRDIPGVSSTIDGLQKIAAQAGGSIGEIASSLDRARNAAAQDTGPLGTVRDTLKGVADNTKEFNKDAPGLEGLLGRIGGKANTAAAGVGSLSTALHALNEIKDFPGLKQVEDFIANVPADMGEWVHQHLHLPDLSHLPGFKSEYGEPDAPPSGLDRFVKDLKDRDDRKKLQGLLAPGGLASAPVSPSTPWARIPSVIGGLPSGSAPSSSPSFGGSGLLGGGSGGINLDTIPVSVQKYANDCIDASARIILSHSGINMTEDQLKGIIPAGGTIGSLAAGLNSLNPAGRFTAMQGSGGSPAAMFAAIKASIDSGTGSILNVAPGSSIAGRPFSEGHFIAATGYNPDGTINLSDTAGGTRYSVTAADAFQATRGRGIVAGTGSGSSAAKNGAGGGDQIPTGAEHDPIYTMQAQSGAGGSSGSPFEQQGQELGQGLGKGFLQLLGLDGSVFGGKSPLDWGAVKLGMGALNWGLGQAKAAGGGGGPMGSPMGAMGGGGGGALGALTGLIPSPGAAVSAAAVPGGSPSYGVERAGDAKAMTYNNNAVNMYGVKDTGDGIQRWNWEHNAVRPFKTADRYAGMSSGLPPGPGG